MGSALLLRYHLFLGDLHEMTLVNENHKPNHFNILLAQANTHLIFCYLLSYLSVFSFSFTSFFLIRKIVRAWRAGFGDVVSHPPLILSPTCAK